MENKRDDVCFNTILIILLSKISKSVTLVREHFLQTYIVGLLCNLYKLSAKIFFYVYSYVCTQTTYKIEYMCT